MLPRLGPCRRLTPIAPMTPDNARIPRVGANPIALRIRQARHVPIILDMLTSIVARGRYLTWVGSGRGCPSPRWSGRCSQRTARAAPLMV